MRNVFTQLIAGDSNKSEAGGNLTIEISGLKMTRTTAHKPVAFENGIAKVGDDTNHNETVQAEVQNLRLSGEIKGTMSGFFKIIAELDDQLKHECRCRVEENKKVSDAKTVKSQNDCNSPAPRYDARLADRNKMKNEINKILSKPNLDNEDINTILYLTGQLAGSAVKIYKHE